jgi:hypothetical protein
MGSNDLDNGKVDGFPNGEDDMSKKTSKLKTNLTWEERHGPAVAVRVTHDPSTDIVSMVETVNASGLIIEQCYPIPREDEARPCTLCESRRPIGTSYSRVYCTKSNARYCKCSYCGHTWTQERK